MLETMDKIINTVIIKRNGRKVDFDGTKIALAIKKGFDSIRSGEDEDHAKYNENDVNKVYHSVINRIEEMNKERMKIEEVQDLIEEELKAQGYEDVYESFSDYRERRSQSRKLFFDEKTQHKFLKALENLGLKSAHEEDVYKRQVILLMDGMEKEI